MAINKIKGAGIAVKGFGKAMKSMMKKAFVKKPTFPGPNATNILNKEIQKKKIGPGFKGQDVVESAARMRKGKPGKSSIELYARINRAALRDQAKSAKMPKEYKRIK